MKKTAHKQPVGGTATNLTPPIVKDRPEESYHEKKKRSWIDNVIIAVVVFLAGVVIYLSFGNTAKLALLLALNPHLAACLVEMLFGSLLFIRARQRALQRNVPLFLDIGYFTSLVFVTGVNMWGLGQVHPSGYIVGAVVTGAMWLMENTLVWLWTDSHRPHEKSTREIKREINKELEKERISQWVVWRRHEGKKPDLSLIKLAKKAERKRRKIVKKGLPYFFQTEYQTPDKQIAQSEHDEQHQAPNKQTPHVKQMSNKQTDQTPNKPNEQTPDKANKQTSNTEQTPDKQNLNNQTEQTDQDKQPNEQTDGATKQSKTNEQTERQRANKQQSEQANIKQTLNNQTKQTTEQTNIKRAPNKQGDINKTNKADKKPNEQEKQTVQVAKQKAQSKQNDSGTNKQDTEANKQAPDKQTDTEQTAEQVTELATKQTNKQTSDKKTNNVVYIKQTNKKPTYEELLEMLDQYYKEKKDLPTVRAFAEQANVKPNRSYTAIKKWEKANGWEGKKKTANK